MANAEQLRQDGELASHRSQLLAALRTRAGVRQAFLLAEILAPPVAMRSSRSPLAPQTLRLVSRPRLPL